MYYLFVLCLLSATSLSFGKRSQIYEFRHARDYSPAHEVVKASNSMGFSIWQQLPRSGNVFMSPFSISMAMGMVFLGARNQTAAEMARVLRYESAKLQPEDIPVGHKQTIDIVRQDSDPKTKGNTYNLEIANAMLVDKTFNMHPQYKDKARYFYDAVVETVSFSSHAEDTLQSINGWTAWKTHNKITSILEEPLDPLTKIFLMNAIYFKGTWKVKFDQRLTMPDTFYNGGKIPTTVPMMRQKKKFNYGFVNQLKSNAIELPYEGEHITMLILLPEKRDGLPEVEALLSRDLVESIPNSLREMTVQVTLPRFNLVEGYDMMEVFNAMGLRTLFDPDYADLTGMSDKKGLYVSTMIHKSAIDVNEEGSEAASVTAVGAVVRTGGPLHPLFTADHPFVFFIRDNRTNAFLFMGRVNIL